MVISREPDREWWRECVLILFSGDFFLLEFVFNIFPEQRTRRQHRTITKSRFVKIMVRQVYSDGGWGTIDFIGKYLFRHLLTFPREEKNSRVVTIGIYFILWLFFFFTGIFLTSRHPIIILYVVIKSILTYFKPCKPHHQSDMWH